MTDNKEEDSAECGFVNKKCRVVQQKRLKSQAKKAKKPVVVVASDIIDIDRLITADENISNSILVDPAGSAFARKRVQKYKGGGLSGALYNKFGMTEKKHNLGKLNYGDAKWNNEFDFEGRIYGMIHACGPDGTSDKVLGRPDSVGYFRKKLRKTIENIAILLKDLLKEKIIKNPKNIELRIPRISGSIYMIDVVEITGNDNRGYYDTLIPAIIEYLGPLKFKLKLSLYGDKEHKEYASYLNWKNGQ